MANTKDDKEPATIPPQFLTAFHSGFQFHRSPPYIGPQEGAQTPGLELLSREGPKPCLLLLPSSNILTLRNPFFIKVDASEMGVGAVLSQRFGQKPKLHTVAFCSKELYLDKENYNVRNRELLNTGCKGPLTCS